VAVASDPNLLLYEISSFLPSFSPLSDLTACTLYPLLRDDVALDCDLVNLSPLDVARRVTRIRDKRSHFLPSLVNSINLERTSVRDGTPFIRIFANALILVARRFSRYPRKVTSRDKTACYIHRRKKVKSVPR
jgi:hypothetical protein